MTITLVKYTNKNLLVSPRKLRLVVNEAKKLSPQKALDFLSFTNNKSARLLVKCLKNVLADAKNNFNLDTSTLKFENFTAREGMKLKRMDKSHGARFNRGIILKRHSQVFITLSGTKKLEDKSVEQNEVKSSKKKINGTKS